jgi:hypothetical protein
MLFHIKAMVLCHTTNWEKVENEGFFFFFFLKKKKKKNSIFSLFSNAN